MKFYVIAIEQIHNGDSIAEYATKSDPLTEKQARSTFYDKLAAVNKDLSDNGHTFMEIKIINSLGGIIKKDQVGEYVEAE